MAWFKVEYEYHYRGCDEFGGPKIRYDMVWADCEEDAMKDVNNRPRCFANGAFEVKDYDPNWE